MAIDKVSVRIGPQMYGRFEDLANTVPHVLAEFIDNALQSSRDYRDSLLRVNPDYKLKVQISIFWDETGAKMSERKAIKFLIVDNAGGIAEDRFVDAFEPAKTPQDNTGLNEFGMGLKIAAYWLGNKWEVATKALGEDVTRIVRFDRRLIAENNLEDVDVKEIPTERNLHFTQISIESPTKNVPTEKSLQKIRTELASIYRNTLRTKELELVVNDESLVFTDYEILNAPYYKNPEGESNVWKKDIYLKIGRYKATGFIGLLKNLKSTQNGLVLSRRGRVIVGAEEAARYFPKSIFGSSIGTPRYKRLFGELELEGFSVSFNKNSLQETDDLTALMEEIARSLRNSEFDYLAQADNYRIDKAEKQIKKIVNRHDNAQKANRRPISIQTTSLFGEEDVVEKPSLKPKEEEKNDVVNEFKQPDVYSINGKNYTLEVKFWKQGPKLCWLSAVKPESNNIVCNINIKHEFFKSFGNPSEPIVALLKTLVIARFTAEKDDDSSANAMMKFFNDFISKTKV